MKIFVSHSSKDKWAARRIAKDLEELGAEVFLDEKDITTGDSIDAAIRQHLKASDHFLILLSPASMGSQWVLIELGGALALEKRIVPILLYVGANEVPSAINLKLARDINEIDKYYAEVGGTPTPPKAATSSTASASPQPKLSTLPVGSSVWIASKSPEKIIRQVGTNITWIPAMDPYLGQRATVLSVDSDGDYGLDVDGDIHAWAREWLKPISAQES